MLMPLDERGLAVRSQYPDLPIVDTTTRRRSKRCRRQGYFMNPPPFGLALRPRLEEPPLLFGTLIHGALDYCYRGHPYDYAGLAGFFQESCVAAIAQIKREYKPWPEQLTRYDEMLDLGTAMLWEYALWAPGLDDFDMIHTEHAGLVPVVIDGAPQALYYFRTDGVARDNRGRLWVVEYKTCKDWWHERALVLDEQPTAYMWAEQEWFGEPITGVLMRFLRKKPVHGPPMLKSGRPTTDVRRLAYVKASAYAEAIDSGATDGEIAALEALQEREREYGHPTIRQEKLERTPYAVREQGCRIAIEVRGLLENVMDARFAFPSPGMHCDYCSVYELCRQMEDGADWAFTEQTMYETAPAMWDTLSVEE